MEYEDNKPQVLQFTAFLTTSPEISERIMALNKLLEPYLADDYVLLSAHLSLYNSGIPEENLDTLRDVLTNYTREMQPLTATTGKIIVRDDGYVMVEIEEFEQFRGIHEDLVRLITPLRKGVLLRKHEDEWDTYSKERQELIKRTGYQYQYKPHLTIGKVNVENVDQARSIVGNENLSGMTFTAKSVELGVGKDGDSIRTGRKTFSFKVGK